MAVHGRRQIRISKLIPKQHGRHFADDIFLTEKMCISIQNSQNPIGNTSPLVLIMAWHQTVMAQIMSSVCPSEGNSDSNVIEFSNLVTQAGYIIQTMAWNKTIAARSCCIIVLSFNFRKWLQSWEAMVSHYDRVFVIIADCTEPTITFVIGVMPFGGQSSISSQ